VIVASAVASVIPLARSATALSSWAATTEDRAPQRALGQRDVAVHVDGQTAFVHRMSVDLIKKRRSDQAKELVDLRGVEPLTSPVRGVRSTN
jgi:hypothetical protein